jgi:type IV secretion system protein VirD4
VTNKGRFPWAFTGVGTLLIALGILIGRVPLRPIQHFAWWMLAVVATALAVRVGWWVAHSRSSQALIARWARRAHKTSGMAAAKEHFLFTSKREMRRLAPQVRPTTYGDERPRKVPVREVATELARVGGIRVPLTRRVVGGKIVWSSIEHHTMTIGPSGSGKSGSLACRVIDAPGACVAVSTTGDLYENTVALRATGGRPVYVMNLGGVVGIPNNLKWSVLADCRDPQIADNRAKDMIPTDARPASNATDWKELGQTTLSMLMHAAACDDRSMRTVFRWVSDPSADSYNEVFTALDKSPEQKVMREYASQFFHNHKPTRDGIVTAIMPALRWLRDSRITAIGDARGDDLFEIGSVLQQGGTVYIIGEENHTTSGLVSALISEIVRAARKQALQMRRQRLDPPLTVALDEAALVCQVPLHKWTAELRGRGIVVHIAIQARSQLRDRWGDFNTGTILTNCTAVIVFGGTLDPDDAEAYSKMAGYRDEPTETTDAGGKVISRTHRRVRVLEPGDFASLEGGTAMVYRRDMHAFLARPRMVWDRRDYRRSLRHRASFVAPIDTSYESEMRADGDGGGDR